MSSLGLRPSLDCRHRCGGSAPSARWWTRRDNRRPTRHRPGDHRQRRGPAPRTRARWSWRGRFRCRERLVHSGRPSLLHRRAPGCSPIWRRIDPVLCMSQPTTSHPGASCAGDNANLLAEGSEKSSAVNAQPRGFITPIMRPTMGPAMSADRRSQIQSTRSIVGAPDAVSSQLRGFTTSPPGEHLWQSSPSNRCPSPPSVRTISLCSVSCPTPARAVDRLAKVSVPVNTVIDDDIRPGHSANESTTSPVPASGCGSTVASSIRCHVERAGRMASPEGSRSNAPSLGLHSFTGLRKSGSKMVKQVPCLRRRCRWSLTGPVPEVSSWSLRWAS